MLQQLPRREVISTKKKRVLHWGRFVDKKYVALPENFPEKVTPKTVPHNASRSTKIYLCRKCYTAPLERHENTK